MKQNKQMLNKIKDNLTNTKIIKKKQRFIDSTIRHTDRQT